MSKPSSVKNAADRLLRGEVGESLEEFLTRSRAEGLSYEAVARDLARHTSGVIEVSVRTIVRWCQALEREAS